LTPTTLRKPSSVNLSTRHWSVSSAARCIEGARRAACRGAGLRPGFDSGRLMTTLSSQRFCAAA
jgi:hypothetical protein